MWRNSERVIGTDGPQQEWISNLTIQDDNLRPFITADAVGSILRHDGPRAEVYDGTRTTCQHT